VSQQPYNGNQKQTKTIFCKYFPTEISLNQKLHGALTGKRKYDRVFGLKRLSPQTLSQKELNDLLLHLPVPMNLDGRVLRVGKAQGMTIECVSAVHLITV
jgi:hypothetical protein